MKEFYEEINKLKKIIKTQNKAILQCQSLVSSNHENLKTLSAKAASNSIVSAMFLPLLIKTNPELTSLVKTAITDILKDLPHEKTNCLESDQFLKEQFTKILKHLETPPEHPYLKVVKTENQKKEKNNA